MAGTYSQNFAQLVFAVKGRQSLIMPEWKLELNKYISGILIHHQQKPIIINGASDHIHCFLGFKPSISISEIVRVIKSNSSKFVNDRNFCKQKFEWQEGFGSFTYSKSQVKAVYNYILNQEEIHKKKTFKEEYLEILKNFEIDYDEKFLFDWVL